VVQLPLLNCDVSYQQEVFSHTLLGGGGGRDGSFRVEAHAVGIAEGMKQLFYDTVSQVCNLVAFANLNLLEADVLAIETVEETDPFA